MGLFKKKSDPISERAKTLNDQIAALQAEIERLSEATPEKVETPVTESEARATAASLSQIRESEISEIIVPAQPQPRLRSTAFPQKSHRSIPITQAAPATSSNPFSSPVFEDVGPGVTEETPPPENSSQPSELGIRKHDLASVWKRWTNHLRGPATSNPKLVSYLAAGSIQGLRPLRYERRVARNRLIVLVVLLIAVLWGLIAVWMKRS